MEIKLKGVTLDTYREKKYDITDFDHIKDVIRENGFTSTNFTILCGESFYAKLRNIMHDYIMAYESFESFTKNGNKFSYRKITKLQSWAAILIEGVIDI